MCRRRQSRERDRDDHLTERERDEQERRKFMSAAKMKRVSIPDETTALVIFTNA
jgi:hypothetical protein